MMADVESYGAYDTDGGCLTSVLALNVKEAAERLEVELKKPGRLPAYRRWEEAGKPVKVRTAYMVMLDA